MSMDHEAPWQPAGDDGGAQRADGPARGRPGHDPGGPAEPLRAHSHDDGGPDGPYSQHPGTQGAGARGPDQRADARDQRDEEPRGELGPQRVAVAATAGVLRARSVDDHGEQDALAGEQDALAGRQAVGVCSCIYVL